MDEVTFDLGFSMEPEITTSDEELASMQYDNEENNAPQRFPDLSSAEIDELVEGTSAKSTNRSTKCHGDIFKSRLKHTFYLDRFTYSKTSI